MKNYLDLVYEYTKAHKKKNRLTKICIIISVMLVTAIFGLANMSVKSQTDEAVRRYGNWHIIISEISDQIAEDIASHKDVAVSGFLGMASSTTYLGKELIVQSSSEELARQMNLTVITGHYPKTEGEALLDQQGFEQFGLSIGDVIEVVFDNGQIGQYRISGTYGVFSSLQGTDAHGLQLAEGGLRTLAEDLYNEYNYIQFKSGRNVNQLISEFKAEYGVTDDQITANIMLLGLMGQSNDTTMLEIYLTALILFVLVTMSGIFMIASSFNMSILERTQFFGLLRCIGATEKQIKRYVRREGLQYCIKSIPVGLFAGCVIIWIAIFVLNELNSQYLPQIPRFQISWYGIIGGVIVGVLVVMIASNSPAKNASRVSPQAAITGNIPQTNSKNFKNVSNSKLFHIDTSMGLRQAYANKKNIALISGSFAISIILFLGFTILTTFMNYALSPLKPYAPDLAIEGVEANVLIPFSLKKEIASLSGIEEVYGRMFYNDISASIDKNSNIATLVSYDDTQLKWADDALISGNVLSLKISNSVLVDYGYSQQFNWRLGDIITLNINDVLHEVTVSGILSDSPFDSSNGEWIIICSENTFTDLTGISDYRIIEMQISQDISDQVRNLITSEMKLLDFQKHNQEIRTGYFAMAVFVYGFLAVIALVALINIVNTINSSISIRMNNYAVMRAVGMSGKQLIKIIRAETTAYIITGIFLGGVLGLILHWFFFTMLITSNWGVLWQPPLSLLLIIILMSILTAFFTIKITTRKIKEINIINISSLY